MGRNTNIDYLMTKKMLEASRKILNTNLLSEEEDKENINKLKSSKIKNAIAITDDPKFGQNVLSQQIEQFKSAVDSGAEFSKSDSEVADNALIYLPETSNLIFSGVIPRLNNLKFQFLLKTNTGNGCFIWADGLILNEENFKTLSKLFGFYQNWCDSWAKEGADLEKLQQQK